MVIHLSVVVYVPGWSMICHVDCAEVSVLTLMTGICEESDCDIDDDDDNDLSDLGGIPKRRRLAREKALER